MGTVATDRGAVSMSGEVELWNRRRFERLAVHCGCWLEGDGLTVYGRTIDLGRGGLFLRTAVPMRHGSRVDIRLQLPGRVSALAACGTVVWAGNVDGRMGVAVEFSTVRDEAELGHFLAGRSTSDLAGAR